MSVRTNGVTEPSSAVSAIAQVRLLVVGDVMLDVWVDGPVRRISPEAPVPVVDVASRSSRLGGAANVAGLAVSLGAEVDVIGLVGADGAGEELREIIEGTGARSDLVVDSERPTTCKTRVVSGGHQVCRLDDEIRRPIDGRCEDAVVELVEDRLGSADVMVLSDYGKGVLTDRVLHVATEAAARRSVPVVADPSGNRAALFGGADVVKPNRSEALAALGADFGDEHSAVDLAVALSERLGGTTVMVTDGRHGIGLAAGGTGSTISGIPREVADVTGAGDAVATTVALVLGAGFDLDMAAALGNAAGAVAVSRFGTAPFTAEDLLSIAAS